MARTVAQEMSGCILKALRITVDDDSELMNGLLRHVRPMLNRMKYDIHIQSSILKDMQENYGELLGLCQSALWCVCKKYSLKEVSLEEASYIAAYYQALLETERLEKKILVVSNSGFGTRQLLVTKLKQYFPTYEIVDVVSMIQLEKRTDLEQMDFLISTVPLENISSPCILVSSVMSDTDIRNIQDTISKSWLEQELSLPLFQKQYGEGKLELYTVEKFDSNILKRHSPYQEERFDWGVLPENCDWNQRRKPDQHLPERGGIRYLEAAHLGQQLRRATGAAFGRLSDALQSPGTQTDGTMLSDGGSAASVLSRIRIRAWCLRYSPGRRR